MTENERLHQIPWNCFLKKSHGERLSVPETLKVQKQPNQRTVAQVYFVPFDTGDYTSRYILSFSLVIFINRKIF